MMESPLSAPPPAPFPALEPPAPVVSAGPMADAPSSRRWWLLAGALVLLALLANANGVVNGFTYDDQYIVFQNRHIHTLHGWWKIFASSYWPREWGAEGYRPLTMLAFALEWTAAGDKAWIFHAVNILLHCVTTIAVFALADAFLPVAAAWIGAALFAVHPVHVEAVGNVVGQSELWVGAFFVSAAAVYVRGRRRGDLSVGATCAVAVLYALACLSKEHAIVLPAVLLAAEVTVIAETRPAERLLDRVRRVRPFMLVLALIGVAFLWARSHVLRDSLAGFQPFVVFQALKLSYSDRVLTMIGCVPEWVRLFLWPARLSSEYTPPYIDIAQGPSLMQLPGLMMLIGVLGLGVVLLRRRPSASFGIWWLVLTLLPTSNFIVAAGIILAERTLYLPSVGAMIAVAAAVPLLREWFSVRRLSMVGALAAAALVAAGGWRSFERTKVWKDNDTLFRQAVKDNPLNYRAHYMLGAWLFEQKRKLEGEREYRLALKLFPYDPFMAYNLGERYREQGMCKPAITMYRWAYAVAPDFNRGRGQFAWCLLIDLQLEEARQMAFRAMTGNDADVRAMRSIVAAADSALVNTGKRPAPPGWVVPPSLRSDAAQDGKLRGSVQNTGREDAAHTPE